MNIYWEHKLQRLWLVISAISLLVPLLFSLEVMQTVNFTTVITVVLAMLFVTAAPFSLLALPLMGLFKFGIELNIDSIFGAYFNIILLNAFGYLQWFWLMPKFFNRGKEYKLPTILEGN